MSEVKDMAEAIGEAQEGKEPQGTELPDAPHPLLKGLPVGAQEPPPRWCPFARVKPAKIDESGQLSHEGIANSFNRYDTGLPTVHWPVAASCMKESCAVFVPPKIEPLGEKGSDGRQEFRFTEGRCGLTPTP